MKGITKIVIALVAGVLFSCASGEKEEGVKIYGQVEQLVPDGWVRLEKIEQQGATPTDTAIIDGEGNYTFYAQIDEPSFFRLNYNNRQFVTLVLTGQESEVEVNADGNDPQGFTEVSGSYDTQYMRDMDEVIKSFKNDVNRINQQAIQARSNGDAVAFQALNVEYQKLVGSNSKQLKALIWESLPSLAAFYGMQQLDAEQHFAFYDSVSTELQQELPENYLVKNLAKMMDARKKLAIGSTAPEIALPSPDGEIISLSSLRGNYVLIDFWAAWCKPCRAENPNVVRVYNQYQDKNFEILGVSLDRTKEAWVGAIEQDGLPWKHISDLQYFKSVAAKTYQINAIPATYLIDPNGIIIAKNLRGPSLVAKLKEIFG